MNIKNQKMVIEEKQFVSIKYKLKFDDENSEVVEETTEENPLEFICGIGRMLPNFEAKLYGLKAGDDFHFSLPPEEAYGKFNQEAVLNISKEFFMDDGILDENLIETGRSLKLRLHDGRTVTGLVKGTTEENVIVDINHPLAGKTLLFWGKILNIREATKSDLSEWGHKCTGCGKH